MIIPKEKINYVFFDSNTVNTIPTLASFVRVFLYNDLRLRPFFNNRTLCNLNYSGLYCGSLADIHKAFDGKKYSGTPTKIYFAKNAVYPRYKLREYGNIKIKRDPAKADAAVVHKIELAEAYQNIGPKYSSYCLRDLTKQKVMYSASKDMYYIFWDSTDKIPEIYQRTTQGVFDTYLKSTQYTKATFMMYFAQECANMNIIPTDCVQVYEGTLTALNAENYDAIDKLENTPNMQILYDTELDAFITTQLQKMTDSDVQTLVSMLSSNDQSVVAMGIKLLATYDIQNSICTTGTILASCWSNLRYNDATKSVGFKSVLNTLGVDRNDFSTYSSNAPLINKLYKASQNEDDRNTCKTAILKKIEADLLNEFEKMKKMYSNFDININLSIY